MSRDANRQFLIFIHGVGGPPTGEWLRPLSDVMAQLGHSRPESSGVEVITGDYRTTLLRPLEGKLPEETWRRPRDLERLSSEYQIRRAEIERLIRPHRSAGPRLHVGQVGDTTAQHMAALVEKALRAFRQEARRYRLDSYARASVLRQLRDQIPNRGHGVIVAHSLGSVVAADLVKRLPNGVVIDQLITLGSPLPLKGFWPFLQLSGSDFPFGRVTSWTNVFDSRDFVSSGRGIGTIYEEALDVDVHVGAMASLLSNHAASTYLSLPVVGALVGDSLFGPVSEPATQAPARRRGSAWDLYLLAAAYATQISITCDPKKHSWRRRFNAARHASVSKLLGAADEETGQLVGTDAYPFPTAPDLLDHAATLVKGNWTDDELLPFAIALLMSSPVQPFDISVDDRHAEEALVALLDRVREGTGNIADQVFAKRVAKALDDAKEAMGGSRAWALMLIGGAAVLAATGIGVWAAAPAGLAGAALLTSTLAAFGPGGMVGGMVTIAAASGAGSALLGAGLATSPSEGRASFVHFTGSLARLPKDQLRATVTAMIAVLFAQEALSLSSTFEQTRSVLSAALSHIENEKNTHLAVSSERAKDWEAKRRIVDRAISIIDDRFPSPLRQGLRLALERSGQLPRIRAEDVDALVTAPVSDPLTALERGKGDGEDG